ncbi:MAG: PLP-dependent transferase, partial [Proteobacteria bacterium]|nr:PLP-dependent transferase [Pseudomonadota bacterium]
TRVFCNVALKKLGVETTFYDPRIGAGIEALMQPNTRVVFLESPGSLTFEVQDLPSIATVAHKHDAMVLIDNTWATPLYHQPLELGADVSIHSLTKYVIGHSDAMLGAAVANERAFERLRRMTFVHGHAAAPDDVFLALRGLRTLDTRLSRHAETVTKLMHWLQARPEVERVVHPALPVHPEHAIWQRDFSGTPSVFSVVLKAGLDDAVAAMIDGYDHFGIGFSYGGFESLALPIDPSGNRTATRWDVSGPMVRYHAGLEDADDLIDDLARGFERFNATGRTG